MLFLLMLLLWNELFLQLFHLDGLVDGIIHLPILVASCGCFVSAVSCAENIHLGWVGGGGGLYVLMVGGSYGGAHLFVIIILDGF